MTKLQQFINNGLQYFKVPPDMSQLYAASYSMFWVIISVLLSIIAAYAALSAATRINTQKNKASKLAWTLASAMTMGMGVWGMHFIGMLALHLPCHIFFEPFTTLISMFPGVLASGVALGVVWNYGTKHVPPLIGSILLGSGIGLMHYTGMSAMRLEGFVRYTPALFVLSIVVAVGLSYLALRAKNTLKQSNLLVSVILGGAISGMHYTAMSAAYFVRDETAPLPASGFSTNTLAIIIAIITVFLALTVLTFATFSRYWEMTNQLRNSEERWKFALEGAGDGVWDWNPQTDEVLFSTSWKAIIGYAEEGLPKTVTTWVEHFHPEDKDSFVLVLHDYLSGNLLSFVTEFRIPSIDTPWKWISARGKLVNRDPEGKPLRVIGTLTNISATKNLQSQLGQAQKLEAIGQLAAGIAHEINTPIQYIGDNLSALHDNFGDLVAYQQALHDLVDVALTPQLTALADKYDLDFILEDSPKAIKQAQEGVERVAEIVKVMKTFSHIEQGQNKQLINLHQALNNALTISRNSYKYIAEVETDFSPEVGSIECYASELNQVFLNLLINAAHAIEENKAGMGKINIVTRKLDNSVEILIKDNGAGIPVVIQEKVFNLFFTTKEVGKGTGQGLSLSHSIIVEKHSGKLFFESSPGLGTTFHIQLPLKLEERD
jgi:PAS domain S-box-containing protein